MYNYQPPKDNLTHRAVFDDGSYKLYLRLNNEWLFAGRYLKHELKTRAPKCTIVGSLED